MKTRIGFVSNSSSSSFVVALPYKPETIEDLYSMLFGDSDKDTLICDVYGGYKKSQCVTKERASQIVWDNIKDPTVTDPERIKRTLESAFPYVDFDDDGDDDDTYCYRNTVSNTDVKELKKLVRDTYGPHMKYKEDFSPTEMEKYRRRNNAIYSLKDKFAYEKNKYILDKGKFVFVVEYEDHETESSQMEQGSVFDNVPHIKASNH